MLYIYNHTIQLADESDTCPEVEAPDWSGPNRTGPVNCDIYWGAGFTTEGLKVLFFKGPEKNPST